MNFIGKKYQSKNGKVYVVKEINENTTYFTDGTSVDTKFFLDKKFFTEIPTQQPQNFSKPMDRIDPNSFFNQRNPLLEQISSLPSDYVEKLPVDNSIPQRYNNYPVDNSSAVVQSDPELEKEALARKYNLNNSNAVVSNAIEQANKQNNGFLNNPKIAKMLEEENMVLNQMPTQQAQVQMTQPVVQQHSVPPDNYREIYQPSAREINPVVENKQPMQYDYIDPIISMFKRTKRNTDFKVTIDLNRKIPRLDTIEMLEDSYETSIIEYLAEEFTQQLLSNPNEIKNKIMDELQAMLEKHSGEERPKKSKKEELTTENLLPEKKSKKTKEKIEPEVIDETPVVVEIKNEEETDD